jgi:hypothetical protein
MIDPAQFRQYVVIPSLTLMAPFGPPVTDVAAALLMATAAQESHLGQYLHQVGGPALGVFQIEPPTLANVLRTLPVGLMHLISIGLGTSPQEQIIRDLGYAAVVARWNYWIQPQKLPSSTTAAALWPAYRDMWCRGCAATEDEFLANAKTYASIT